MVSAAGLAGTAAKGVDSALGAAGADSAFGAAGGGAATAAAGGATPAAPATAAPAAPAPALVLRPLRPREEIFVLRSACGGDVRSLCGGVQPGGGRIVQCLAKGSLYLAGLQGSSEPVRCAIDFGSGKFCKKVMAEPVRRCE